MREKAFETARATCASHKGCTGCPCEDGGKCVLIALPRDWDVDRINEILEASLEKPNESAESAEKETKDDSSGSNSASSERED